MPHAAALPELLWPRDAAGRTLYEAPPDLRARRLVDSALRARRQAIMAPPNPPNLPPGQHALITAAANAAAAAVAQGFPDEERIRIIAKDAAKSAVAETLLILGVDIAKLESVDAFRDERRFTRDLKETFAAARRQVMISAIIITATAVSGGLWVAAKLGLK